jgi:hypothetical protein
MSIFHTRNVAPQKSGALFNVALAEFLLFAKFAESVAYDHFGIIPSRRTEGKAVS